MTSTKPKLSALEQCFHAEFKGKQEYALLTPSPAFATLTGVRKSHVDFYVIGTGRKKKHAMTTTLGQFTGPNKLDLIEAYALFVLAMAITKPCWTLRDTEVAKAKGHFAALGEFYNNFLDVFPGIQDTMAEAASKLEGVEVEVAAGTVTSATLIGALAVLSQLVDLRDNLICIEDNIDVNKAGNEHITISFSPMLHGHQQTCWRLYEKLGFKNPNSSHHATGGNWNRAQPTKP